MIDKNNLPKSWTIARFDDLLDYIQPTEFIVESTEYDDEYKTPVLTAGKSFIKGYTNETKGIFNSLPVIIFDDFTTATQFVNFPFKVKSSAMKILKPTCKLVNIKLAFHFMQTVHIKSDTHKRYWISEYSKLPIPLPPLKEQARIVEKLEELFSDLDKGIESLEKAQQQLKVYRQAVLKWAFEGKLTNKNLNGELPKGWKTVLMKDVCLKVEAVKRIEKKSEEEFLYLDIGGIDNETNKIFAHKIYKWKDAPSRAQQIVFIDDILFSTVRTYMKNIAMIESKIYNKQIASSGFCVIRANKEIILPQYIFYYSTSQIFLQPLNSLQTGSSYPAVRDKDVFAQSIPLPSLKVQQLIVKEIESRLSVCDKIEETISESLLQAEALRLSIIKKAYEGKLVKQKPKDEPATKLLERIRAEKKKNEPEEKVKIKFKKKKELEMNNNTSSIVSKVWSFCNPLRDIGVGYGDYLEQLTYLLFLKMADEYSKPPYSRHLPIPKEYNWESLTSKRGDALELHYSKLLGELSKQKGILGQIFVQSQNKIKEPAMLYKIIDMIDKEQWASLGADIKGTIYEGLLEKNAEDTKSGAGQYFTPRALIRAMVQCVQPEPKKTIADPACGTGGFFLAAYDYIANGNLDKEQKKFLKFQTFHGNEIVPGTRRMCLMNMFLHNIGDIDSDNIISPADALVADTGLRVDYVLANPPFGRKSSMTATNEEGEQEADELTYNRQDFWETSSNKQLNFVQHIRTMLKSTGQAAVVVPDNVLFEGGAGETVRKKLMETTELHTILRLPTGIFYKQGVKANVIFFDNKPAAKEAWTKEIWIYDFRTNIHFTLKENPMKLENLKDFITCYNSNNRHKRKEIFNAETNPDGRWRKFSYDEIIARDKTSLDITWLKDKSLADLDNLPDPDVLAGDIIENLEAGLESFKEIMLTINGKE